MALAILEATRTIDNVIDIDGDLVASPGAVAGGYQNFLICCEMFLGEYYNQFIKRHLDYFITLLVLVFIIDAFRFLLFPYSFRIFHI